MLTTRKAGVLLHITSLPGPEGTGTLGSAARDFGRWLKNNGFTVWQMLPLCHAGYAQSPYLGLSAFAGNPMLIDLQLCEAEYGINLNQKAVKQGRLIDYEKSYVQKMNCLRNWYGMVGEAIRGSGSYRDFCAKESYWLDDYAVFAAYRNATCNKKFEELPLSFRIREKKVMEAIVTEISDEITFFKMLQFEFFRQWNQLRCFLAEEGIQVMGDLPIYVAYDSSDVWQHPGLFSVDDELRLTSVAGVPPDYFSTTGQLWGNPVYMWENHRKSRYAWWKKRLGKMTEMFDCVRIDHFRGFDTYWEIPAGSPTAESGKWMQGPGKSFFDEVLKAEYRNSIIAEDLGESSATVEKLRDDMGFPGMRVLQFAFGEGKCNPHIPHFHTENSVVYPGTHDNDTLAGWLKELKKEDQIRICGYLGCRAQDLHLSVIRAAMASVARLCVVPMQDILKLGTEARMNIPGTSDGNWRWRMKADYKDHPFTSVVSEMIKTYERVQ